MPAVTMNRIAPGVGLLLGLVQLFGVGAHADDNGPVPVIVAAAYEDEIADRVEGLGTLRANESIQLTTTITDTVSRIHFDDGDRVVAGQTLVELNSIEELALLTEARATLQEARTQYDRVKSLARQGTAAQSLLDERRRESETARARLTVIEARLADRVIKAPFAGVLGLRNISPGALVEPGDFITSLDDDSTMKLDLAVPAVFLDGLRPGLTVAATTRSYAGRAFQGQVHSIDSRVDPTTRTVIVRALLPNPEGNLRPGMLMHVDLLLRPRRTVLVPEEALVPKGSSQSVLTIADGKVVQRTVAIGTRQPGRVEVLSGLSAGEQVITQGAVRVRPGQAVRVLGVDDGTRPLGDLLRPQTERP